MAISVPMVLVTLPQEFFLVHQLWVAATLTQIAMKMKGVQLILAV